MRPSARGKFVFLGDEKLYVRGATYGTFRPSERGDQFPEVAVVEHDFAQMAANGLNAIRTYTVPPRWVLDIAAERGLFVLAGIPWEQHVAFLDDRRQTRSIAERVRAGVAACSGHPAILGYVVGNEIPSPIVRWHGRKSVERFLERLYGTAKEADPEALVTYVNYPPTEYLQLPFVDFACFNVYLERQASLEAYLARLHNIAGDRPLLMAEVGLDSQSHGRRTQASVLDWQMRTAFASGCAGAFLFAWTDEWYVSYLSSTGETAPGGEEVDDWDFGLTDRARRPKPALAAVRRVSREVPFSRNGSGPRVSVIVCTFNGEATLRDCLEGLLELDYPDFEVIIVDDGSTDATTAIAEQFPFRLIRTGHRGLANARNAGLQTATGEIVAYIDDDARPDPHWLTYLAATFERTTHAGVGGPNVPPPGGDLTANCIACAPGAPVHVLLSDDEAEHLPGCNMAFRKECLERIGGFDTQFWVAGDDVDLCWRLRDAGFSLGFSPAAMVWHRRRESVGRYWRQQSSYGKAEALLERKWPERYNGAGHLNWRGRMYGHGLTVPFGRWRVYYGTWGSQLFQSLYSPRAGRLSSLPLMPEWYLVIAALAALSIGGIVWRPLLLAAPVTLVAVAASLALAGASAARTSFEDPPRSRPGRLWIRALTALLYLIQPLARLRGRLGSGLTPWRLRARGFGAPLPSTRRIWSERWQSSIDRLNSVESALRADGTHVSRGGPYDRWDLEARGGLLGAVRMRLSVEEHGAGRQMVLLRLWPKCSSWTLALMGIFIALAADAALEGSWLVTIVLGGVAAILVLRGLQECAVATHGVLRWIEQPSATSATGRQRVGQLSADET